MLFPSRNFKFHKWTTYHFPSVFFFFLRDHGNPVSNSDIHCNTSYKLQHKYIHTQHQKINLWTRTQSMSMFVANALSLVTSEHLWLNNELAELRRIWQTVVTAHYFCGHLKVMKLIPKQELNELWEYQTS